MSSTERYTLLAAIAVLLGFVGALWLSVRSLSDRLSFVETGIFQRLVITDPQGLPRIVFDGLGDTTSFSLLDQHGQIRLEASIDTQGTASVFLLDPNTDPRFGAISLATGEVVHYQDRVDSGTPQISPTQVPP